MENNYRGPTTETPNKRMFCFFNIMRHKVALCQHVNLSPSTQVWVKVLTKKSGLIHTKPNNSLWTARYVRSGHGIYKFLSNKPFEVLLTNFSTIETKLPRDMSISYTKKSPDIYLSFSGTMTAEICESLILVVDKATAAPIRKSRNKLTYLSFAGPEEKIAKSTPTYQESLLSLPVKPEPGSVSRQQVPQVSNLNCKAASPPDWESMVDLSLVKYKALKKTIMEVLSEHKNLLCGLLETIKVIYHTADLKKETRPILQRPYRTGLQSLEMLLEHIDKQRKAGEIKPARSEWASPVVLVW